MELPATRRLQDRLLVYAPAKLNLYLAVRGKRPDGYHELCSLLVALDWYDTLLFQPAARQQEPVRIRSNVAALEGQENLVVRAVQMLRARLGVPPHPLRLWLQKRIPHGAGLGGGSSDAAATLVALARHYGGSVLRRTLVQWSAELGSDCPFFAAGVPAAVVYGRGEEVVPVELPVLDVVVHWPGVRLSTRQVFERFRLCGTAAGSPERLLEALRSGVCGRELNFLLRNDLYESAAALAPAIARSLEALSSCGLAASMSGSGSTVFGIARNREEAIHVARQLKQQKVEGLVTVTRTLG